MFNKPGGRKRARLAMLKMMADGHVLFRESPNSIEAWHMRFPNATTSQPVNATIVRELYSQGLIEPNGPRRFKLTAAGRTAIAPKEATTETTKA